MKEIGQLNLMVIQWHIRCCTITLVLLFNLGLNAQNKQDSKAHFNNPAVEALDSMKNLAGKWQGSFKWTGVMKGEGEIEAEYYLTGYGSSLVENLLSQDGIVTMSSIYYLDADSLWMTHFCAANNHPRLVASNLGKSKNRLMFDFVDITNLKTPGPGHVNAVILEFIDQNHINIIFEFTSSKGESVETIWLERVATK